MTLHEQIKNNIKESMKSGDKVRLEVMRGLVTAFTNELVATKRTPQDLLTDEEAIKVITRASKQRKDSIEQFTKGDRMDLVDIETDQLHILEEFLPKLMEIGEIEEFVKGKIEELPTKDVSKKGMFIASIMKDLKGKADGAIVKEVVDKLFV
ncbi:MAG: GatB/YqeY domain-containing protein [Candidatus Nomurabacteria bacterium]|nr:GatB/YqeY domain-containing protein [Candidatus Nomurabacteria bacterium]